jgi:hypothetical protein
MPPQGLREDKKNPQADSEAKKGVDKILNTCIITKYNFSEIPRTREKSMSYVLIRNIAITTAAGAPLCSLLLLLLGLGIKPPGLMMT